MAEWLAAIPPFFFKSLLDDAFVLANSGRGERPEAKGD